MTTLIRPDNKQPAEFVATSRGFVCLRIQDTITPAVRWYPLAAIESVNPLYTCTEPPAPKLVVLTPSLLANVNASAGVRFMKPVSLFDKSMVA